MNKNTNEYIKRAHEMACNHGFHDKELSVEHCLMLVLTEISEMVEADRKYKHAHVAMYKKEINTQPTSLKQAHKKFCFETFIKDTFEDEMADACIRLYDTAGTFGVTFEKGDIDIDMHDEYTIYFSSLSLTEKAFALCGVLLKVLGEKESIKDVIGSALCLIELMAEEMEIDLFWFIERKMEYNETRKKLHGKKY